MGSLTPREVQICGSNPQPRHAIIASSMLRMQTKSDSAFCQIAVVLLGLISIQRNARNVYAAECSAYMQRSLRLAVVSVASIALAAYLLPFIAFVANLLVRDDGGEETENKETEVSG